MKASLPQKKFIRTIEDFTCGRCTSHVKGNGYTNHCPRCLWSRHVDIHPGDREAACRGLMEPVSLTVRGNEYVITHQCVACGFMRNNKTNEKDDSEAIIGLARMTAYPVQ